MQNAIQQFIEVFVQLPPINPEDTTNTENFHMKCINGVNVVGVRNVLPVIGETLCISSGGNPITSVVKIMKAFKESLGEPALTNFFVNIKSENISERLREVGKFEMEVQGYSRFSLPDDILEEENWGLIGYLGRFLGEPANWSINCSSQGIWNFSIFHYWEPGRISI